MYRNIVIHCALYYNGTKRLEIRDPITVKYFPLCNLVLKL